MRPSKTKDLSYNGMLHSLEVPTSLQKRMRKPWWLA